MSIIKLIKNILVIVVLGTLMSCNQAFVAGMANGLAGKSYNPSSSSSAYSNQLELNRLKRQQEEIKASQKKMERSARSSCRDLGGRWRVGRCKF